MKKLTKNAIYPFLLLLPVAAWSLLRGMHRDLWFDEALTMLNFVRLPGWSEIYRQYVIPNNQIVHTMLLQSFEPFAAQWGDYAFGLRLFPFLTATGLLALLYWGFRARLGSWTLAIALAAMALSPAFAIYGTALRGYMLGAFFSVAALLFAMNFARTASKTAWGGFFLTSLLAVGTIPTNLAGLAAAVLYALPLAGHRFYRTWRFWILALTPILALMCFYLPIWPQFINCSRLGEGWSDGMRALGTLLALAMYSFAVLLLPMILGMAMLPPRARFNWTFSARAAIWLLPIPACLILPVAPFPRTFFCLLPFWALLVAGGLHRLAAYQCRLSRRWAMGTLFAALGAATLFWGYIGDYEGLRFAFSRRFGKAEADDYFAPYYMRDSFAPRQQLQLLRKEHPELNPPRVFASFNADPWAYWFAMLTSDQWNVDSMIFDGPRGKVAELPPGSFLILRNDEDPGVFSERFGAPLNLVTSFKRNSVYSL